MRDYLPTEEERIEEIFREIEIEEFMAADEEPVDEINDFTEAGFEPGDIGL